MPIYYTIYEATRMDYKLNSNKIAMKENVECFLFFNFKSVKLLRKWKLSR